MSISDWGRQGAEYLKKRQLANVRLAQDYADPTVKMGLGQRLRGMAYAQIEDATFGRMGVLGTILQQKRENYGQQQGAGFRQSISSIAQQNLFGGMGVLGQALQAQFTQYPYSAIQRKEEPQVNAENIVKVIGVIDKKFSQNIEDLQKSFNKLSKVTERNFERTTKTFNTAFTDINKKVSMIDNTLTSVSQQVSDYSKFKMITERRLQELSKKNDDAPDENTTTGQIKRSGLDARILPFARKAIAKGALGKTAASAAEGLISTETAIGIAGGTAVGSAGRVIGIRGAIAAVGAVIAIPEVAAVLAAVGVIGLGAYTISRLKNMPDAEAKDEPKKILETKAEKIDLNVSDFSIKAKNYISIQSEKTLELKAKKIILDADEIVINGNSTNPKTKTNYNQNQYKPGIQKASYNPNEAVNSLENPQNPNDPGSNPFSNQSGSGSIASDNNSNVIQRQSAPSITGQDSGNYGKNSAAGSFFGQTNAKLNEDAMTANSSGPLNRSAYAEEMKNPEVRKRMMALTIAEVGEGNHSAQTALMETIFNRAAARKQSLMKTMQSDYYAPFKDGGYNRALKKLESNPQLVKHLEDNIIPSVQGGSNVSNFATGNASGTVGFGKGGYGVSSFGGERFGVEAADRKWVDGVKSAPLSNNSDKFAMTTNEPYSTDQINKMAGSLNDPKRVTIGVNPEYEGSERAISDIQKSGANLHLYHQGPGGPTAGVMTKSEIALQQKYDKEGGWENNLRGMLSKYNPKTHEIDNLDQMKDPVGWLEKHTQYLKDNNIDSKVVLKNMNKELLEKIKGNSNIDQSKISNMHISERTNPEMNAMADGAKKAGLQFGMGQVDTFNTSEYQTKGLVNVPGSSPGNGFSQITQYKPDSITKEAGTPTGLHQVISSSSLSGSVGGRSASRGAGQHQGVDMMAKAGSSVYSPADGKVVKIGTDNFGKATLTIQHSDGTYTRFLHMKENNVKIGDTVKGGDEVGKSGEANGVDHLHVERWDKAPNHQGDGLRDPRKDFNLGRAEGKMSSPVTGGSPVYQANKDDENKPIPLNQRGIANFRPQKIDGSIPQVAGITLGETPAGIDKPQMADRPDAVTTAQGMDKKEPVASAPPVVADKPKSGGTDKVTKNEEDSNKIEQPSHNPEQQDATPESNSRGRQELET